MATLVVVPIEHEIAAMTEVLGEMGYAGEERAVGRLTATEFADGRLIVASGGLGKTQFGVQTQHLLDNMDGVDAVICAGTSGALADSVNKFDVVIATETIEHDFNRGNTLIVLPLPTYAGDAALIAAARELAASKRFGFALRFGGVASGDEGIASRERAREVREATGAMAVAWEGAGGARAAELAGVPFLEVRGISDGAGEAALEEFWANIPATMRSVTAVVAGLVGLD